MKRIIIVIILVAVALSILYAKLWRTNGSENVISGTGTIEATEVVVCSKVQGRVEKLYMNKGTVVKKGQVIAKIEQEEFRNIVKVAEANYELAQVQLSQLQTAAHLEMETTNAQIEQAQSRLLQAKANLEATEKEFLRIKKLFDEGASTQQLLDSIQAKYTTDGEGLNTAKSGLELSLANKLKNKMKEDEVEKAKAQLKLAEADLELKRISLNETIIKTPLGGTVLLKSIEEGELANPGLPLATIANLNDVWVKIYIKETDLGRVKLGQMARVRVDSFPGRIFKGKVSFIAQEAEFTPKNIQTKEERTMQVFGVEVAILNPQGIIKPGMPADAEILMKSDESDKSDLSDSSDKSDSSD